MLIFEVYIPLAYSYDSVVPVNEVSGANPETTPLRPEQWLVSSRWLLDTDHFNEWTNEEDYELIPVVRHCYMYFTIQQTGYNIIVAMIHVGWSAPTDGPLPWRNKKELYKESGGVR